MDRIRYCVLTASDGAYRGKRRDESGDIIVDKMSEVHALRIEYKIMPDLRDTLAKQMKEWVSRGDVDLIISTGGTGFTRRDVTPEATVDVIERLVPGIPEAIRAKGYEKTARAILSRATAGIARKTLIVNLAGSPGAVLDGMEVLLEILPHAIETLRSESGVECRETFA